MASKDFTATDVPRSLESVLGLQIGTTYYLQNVSASASLRLRSAAVKPAASARAHIIQSGGDITISPQMNVATWAWTDDGTCPSIVTEGP